jgi:NifU-like protein involved in Fe-S cluster formation
MAELDAIYNPRFLELAAATPRAGRLAHPDSSATAHSKLCGSTVTVDVVVRDGRIADYAQTVKACLLGQAAAAVVGREAVGSTADEIRAVGGTMRRMLREDGPPPTGRWADLALLEPVRHYKARHASTLLVFDALERALGEIEARRGVAATLDAASGGRQSNAGR